MENLLILAAWIAVVTVVGLVATRPWTAPAARAPLPLALGIGVAAWVIGTGYRSYLNLMADGSWTAATIAIPFVPAKAVVLSLIAYAAGRTINAARITARTDKTAQPWILPVALAGLTLFAVGSDVMALRADARERHAANPALTSEETAALVRRVRGGDAARDEIGAFLGNPLCPPELLTEYAASPESYWRTAVARNDAIDAALSAKLAGDPDEAVRLYLSFNRKLPPEILTRLAADESESVRDTVVWTEGLPDEAFNRLVEDPSPRVRANAARQTRLSPEQLEKLRNDPEQRVRDAANRWTTPGG